MDKAFLTATAIPLMGLAGAIAYKFRPLEWQKEEGRRVWNATHVVRFPCLWQNSCVHFAAVTLARLACSMHSLVRNDAQGLLHALICTAAA